MTPGEWAGIAGAILAVGALADRLVQRLSAPAPTAPREALLPPAPPPPAPRADIDERVLRLETSAHELEVKVISELRALATLINERTERSARRGSNG